MTAIEDARRFAAERCADDVLGHATRVGELVAEAGATDDVVVAATLHVVLDDATTTTPAELEERFGPRVREIVELLAERGDGEKARWRDRERAAIADREVALLLAADELDELRLLQRSRQWPGRERLERYVENIAVVWRHDLPLAWVGELRQLLRLACDEGFAPAGA
jgi:(p)ppGpp synthase/HD superfamily hydrolase